MLNYSLEYLFSYHLQLNPPETLGPVPEGIRANVYTATGSVTGEKVQGKLGSLDGKILIDATNPLTPDYTRLEIGLSNSGGEEVARKALGAKVVKAYNSVAQTSFRANLRCLERCVLLCSSVVTMLKPNELLPL